MGAVTGRGFVGTTFIVDEETAGGGVGLGRVGARRGAAIGFGARGSFGGVGGFATGTGFFLITTVDSSAVFFGITLGSTTTCLRTGTSIIGAVDRGSPRRFNSTAFSAYSLT